jgi:Flp pilus assembly protein TadB
MLPALLSGVGVGLGSWFCLRALRPAARPLHTELALLARPRWQTTTTQTPEPAWRVRLVEIARSLASFDHDSSVDADLACLERNPERYALERLAAAVAGLFVPLLFSAVCAAGGVAVPPALILFSALVCGGGGFIVPRLLVRSEAARRRDDFRHGLSAYLDLVAILLAGGRGVESALWDAARTGSGWAFGIIRAGLETGVREGRSPWAALSEVAERLDLADLGQLTSSITLAGDSGAKVKASLTAKAASLRDHELAAAEAASERATEQMAGPVVMLLVAFLLFIGWPAVANVLAL